MTDTTLYRDRAQQHQDESDMRYRWYTPQELADRWSISITSVKAIPSSELPYETFGRGAKHRMRRYAPEAVAAFESRAKPHTQHAA